MTPRRTFHLGLRSRRGLRDEVREELAHHIVASAERLMREGMSPDEARAEAVRRLGTGADVERTLYDSARRREQRVRLRERIIAVAGDLRLVIRSLGRQPGLTAVVIFTLALGIGANVSVFPVVDRLLFRPPAGVRAPADVRRIHVNERGEQGRIEVRSIFSYPEYDDIREALTPFTEVAAYATRPISIAGDTDPVRVVGMAYTSAGYARVLGVRMALGRFFAPDEDMPANPQLVAVIGHDVWTARLGADSGIIGGPLQIGSRTFTVIGVTEPGFEGIDVAPTGVWLPSATQTFMSGGSVPWWRSRSVYAWHIVTRVRGASDAALGDAATRHVRAVAASADLSLPGAERGATSTSARVQLGPLIDARGPGKAAPSTTIATRVAGVSLVLLLIAIANVTSLLLARGARREREIAVRRALGVGRARLMQLFVLEAATIAVLAAALAGVCAVVLRGVVRGLLLPDIRWVPPALDSRSVIVTAILALACALVAGAVPAMHALRSDLSEPLRTGAREGGGRRMRLRSGLLTAQAALSVILLVGAGLFMTSIDRAHNADTGYALDRLAAISVSIRLPEAGRRAALEAALARAADLPDVESVALARVTPLRGLMGFDTYMPGRDSALAEGFAPDVNGVSPEYFATTGLPIRRGRSFTAEDGRGAEPVLIVNEHAARVLWPDGDAMGRCLYLGSRESGCRRVVGIVANARRFRLLETLTPLQAYVPLDQLPDSSGPSALLIRSRGEPSAAMDLVRPVITDALGDASSSFVYRYSEWLAPQLRSWRLGAQLFGSLAGLSLLLAIAGLYSVVAHSVTRRTHEIGVRMALGARGAALVRLIVGQELRPIALGLMLGLLIAALAGRALATLLFETSPRDPGVYLAVVVVLLAASVAAAAIPAMRARRVNPVDALRAD